MNCVITLLGRCNRVNGGENLRGLALKNFAQRHRVAKKQQNVTLLRRASVRSARCQSFFRKEEMNRGVRRKFDASRWIFAGRNHENRERRGSSPNFVDFWEREWKRKEGEQMENREEADEWGIGVPACPGCGALAEKNSGEGHSSVLREPWQCWRRVKCVLGFQWASDAQCRPDRRDAYPPFRCCDTQHFICFTSST